MVTNEQITHDIKTFLSNSGLSNIIQMSNKRNCVFTVYDNRMGITTHEKNTKLRTLHIDLMTSNDVDNQHIIDEIEKYEKMIVNDSGTVQAHKHTKNDIKSEFSIDLDMGHINISEAIIKHIYRTIKGTYDGFFNSLPNITVTGIGDLHTKLNNTIGGSFTQYVLVNTRPIYNIDAIYNNQIRIIQSDLVPPNKVLICDNIDMVTTEIYDISTYQVHDRPNTYHITTSIVAPSLTHTPNNRIIAIDLP